MSPLVRRALRRVGLSAGLSLALGGCVSAAVDTDLPPAPAPAPAPRPPSPPSAAPRAPSLEPPPDLFDDTPPTRWRVMAADAGTAPRDAGTAPRDAGAPTPPSGEPCGRFAGWSTWLCLDAATRVRCVSNVLQRETCSTRCVPQPAGYDAVCAPSETGCGRYAGWTAWTCIDARTRVRCVGQRVETQTCAERCVVQASADDTCAAANTPPPDDACTSSTTCGACTQRSNCGFCRAMGRCYLGTSAGPINRACPTADWSWLPTHCTGAPPPPPTDACASSTTCATCTPRSGCGFCRSTNRCASGNAAGATAGDCAAADWVWDAAGCPGATPPPPPSPPPPPPTPPPTPSPPEGPPMCVSTVPTGGFCSAPGSCNLAAPTVTECSTGAAYDFYGREYCTARATVIVVGTGWCGACQREAPEVESQVTRVYAGRGVRVVTMLTENSDRRAATTDFCLRWQSRYGLTSRMVIDPANSIARRVRLSAYPFVVVVDRQGRLRLAEAAPRLSRITSTLETILREP